MKIPYGQAMLPTAAAWLFVLIWSTGFVVARGISGLIDPYLFLLVRFSSVLLIFTLAMLITRSILPKTSDRWRLMGIGALMQGMYLGPSFWAVSQGLEAGVMSLIGCMQPPMTAIAAWYFFREQIGVWNVAGLMIGIAGISLALWPDAGEQTQGAPEIAVILAAVLSIASLTTATLLQKSSVVSVPLLSSVTFQTLGAVLIMFVMAVLNGQWQFAVNPGTMGYLLYAILILSIGGFTLLMWLVRQGSATRASTLLLLTPPMAALMSWWLYGEQLSRVQIAGFILALIGVLLARHQKTQRPNNC